MEPQRSRKYQFDLIATPLFLLCLVGVGWYSFKLVRTLTIASQMSNWASAESKLQYCFMGKKLHQSGEHRRSVSYVPRVLYKYKVGSTVHSSESFMLMDPTFRSEAAGWEYLKNMVGIERSCQYPHCPWVKVYYDPQRPERAVLLRELLLWRTIVWHLVYILGLGIFAIGGVMAMRNPYYRKAATRQSPI
ncbi:DUF3592 domain-containing protein [Oligoflexia bacterium]|nr:DUF3592 domain-containing protein [Oligoflexia bacterium]